MNDQQVYCLEVAYNADRTNYSSVLGTACRATNKLVWDLSAAHLHLLSPSPLSVRSHNDMAAIIANTRIITAAAPAKSARRAAPGELFVARGVSSDFFSRRLPSNSYY